jgi:transposase
VDQLELDNVSLEAATKFASLSKEALIDRLTFVEDEYHRALKEIYRLKNQNLTDAQIHLILSEQLGAANAALFGVSSERYRKREKPAKEKQPAKPGRKQPSIRYPNVPIREVVIAADPVPACDACGLQMSDSGMRECSEQLTVIPKRYEIISQKLVKYRCSCHGCVSTAKAPERIIPGSTYSDEMVLDVALSKYCDLLPIHRYVAMAERSGVAGLPPQSLIECTHGLADFLLPAYDLLEEQAMSARVLSADETPHKMLEGSNTKNWSLWGFSTPQVCFLTCHDTRSGDVASEVLEKSKCEVLVSDVYTGYGKATRICNELRQRAKLPMLQNAYCNAHARRYFFKSWKSPVKYGQYYLDQYHEIYDLNEEARGQEADKVLEYRRQMRSLFEGMRTQAESELSSHSEKSQYGKALRYFVGNYVGLTLFLNDAEVPIDNNRQERLLRSHVVGRKTWYGTHSERGANTAAVLFSLVESCKLIHVNPREYFKKLTAALLAGEKPFTPHDFKLLTN